MITMSSNWAYDIEQMHQHYGFHEHFGNFDPETRLKFLEFRARFLQEELDELNHAIKTRNPEEIVDSLADLLVVAIGTLDANGINAHRAWDEVLKANMNKHVGIKEGRENPLGLPDLFKKPDWTPPDHSGNHGWLWQLALVEGSENP